MIPGFFTEFSTPAISLLRNILGNPGIAEFYTPFLTALRNDCSSSGVVMLAHSHLGHCPTLQQPDSNSLGLTSQIEAICELYDSMRSHFPVKETRFILVGHSMGAWLALQVCILVSPFVILCGTIEHSTCRCLNKDRMSILYFCFVRLYLTLLAHQMEGNFRYCPFTTWCFPCHNPHVCNHSGCSSTRGHGLYH
jgi:hypothetical protein